MRSLCVERQHRGLFKPAEVHHKVSHSASGLAAFPYPETLTALHIQSLA